MQKRSRIVGLVLLLFGLMSFFSSLSNPPRPPAQPTSRRAHGIYVESQVDANNSDPVHFTNTLYGSAPLRMRFQAKTRARRGDYNNRRIVGNDPEVADDLLKFR